MSFCKPIRDVTQLLGIILALNISPPTASAWTGKVLRIVDGDTYVIVDNGGGKHRIRLYGVDCPEKEQPGGHMAAAIATRFLDGESVKIIQIQKDRNGRIVAIVIMPDGLPLQEILLLHGMAWVDNRYCKSQKCEAWRALEAAARISGRGIWKSPKPTAPWDWRRQRRRGTLKGYE